MLAITHKTPAVARLSGAHRHTYMHTQTHTHTPPPSLYANHASEHEQTTESPEREQGWLPPSLLLHFLLHPTL